MISLKNILLHTIFILFVSCCGTGGCPFIDSSYSNGELETTPIIENKAIPTQQDKQELVVKEKTQPEVKSDTSQSHITAVDKKMAIKEKITKVHKVKEVSKKITTPKKNIPKAKFVPFTNAPEVINSISPSYPQYELDNGIEGIVYIQFRIDTLGNVAESYIAKSSKNDNLDNAALNAVQTSKWQPARNQGKSVSVWQTLPFEFKLR